MRFAVAFLTATVAAAVVGCSGDDAGAEKRVMGTDGRERWVVKLDGTPPDLGPYRQLLQERPADAEGFAEKMRQKLAQDHADFESALSALNGRVVEHWWMSNAVTVEVEAGGVPSLQKAPGVVSVSPDVALGE
jgi:hypothetical protein